LAGEKAKETTAPMDSDEAGQLLGLFDEWVRVQWALAHPSPGGDPSGVQPISFMAAITLGTHYARYSALWQAIPESNRRHILSWRDSTEGKKERDVLYETAKELSTVLDIQAHMRRVEGKFTPLQERWRVLVQSAKPD
jgi:hypothetical protein